jgi:hypothetical protein
VETDEQGATEQMTYTRRETRWAGVRRVGVTRRSIFLYINPQEAYLIPRRAFADESSGSFGR